MSELLVLKPVEPVAKCGLCNNDIYPDGRCQIASGIKPNACPLNGEQWRMLDRARQMANAYPWPPRDGG